MTETGRVKEVSAVPFGDAVIADHAIGATVLSMNAVVDFDEGGGTLSFVSPVDDVTTVVAAYTKTDPDADTITLTAPLTVALPTDSFVSPHPPSNEKVALVLLDDQDDPLTATVPHALYSLLPEGVRDPEAEEAVSVEQDTGGEWFIAEVFGKVPMQDGAYIDPATVPASPAAPPLAPVAPTFNLTGMPRGVMVQITNGLPGWVYTYTVTEYLTDPTTGIVSTSVQTYPDTSRPILYAENMPDGTPMLASADGYSWHITATNVSGSATSPESAVKALVLNDSTTIAELSVGKLLAGDLIGAFALLGALKVGSSITIDDDNGIVIAQPDGGKIKFPANGGAADISAHLDAFSLTVRDRLKVQGLLNEITVGAVVALSSGVTAPGQPPTVSTTWKSAKWDFAPGGFEDTMQGLVHYGTAWYATSVYYGGSDARSVDNNGVGTGFAKAMPAGMYALGGITVISNTAYVLVYDTNRPDNANAQPFRWFVRRYDLASAWAFLGEWEYTGYPNSNYNPTIGRTEDGTRILIARCAPNDGKPRINRFTLLGAADGTTPLVIGNAVVNANLSSVWYGFADMIGDRYVVSSENAIYTFDTTGARFTAQEWTRAGASKIRGLHWDTSVSKWFHLDDKGNRWEYGTTTSDTARSVAYSWFDADAAGTGQHETAPGTAFPYTQLKRAYFTVSTNPPNDTGGTDDPNSVRIWIGGQRQPDLGFVGAAPILTALYDVPSTGTVSKAADFPAALTPALLRSGASADGDFTIKMSGSGAWRLGDISGDVNGRVLGGAFVPIGGAIEFHGSAAQVPVGWLLCDGSAVQENTHPLLFNFLVTAGGVASGTAPNRTVPRPDHRRRFGVGATSNLALGATEGIALDTSRLLGHSHTVDAHDHGLAAGTTAAVPTGTGGGQRMTGAGTTGSRTAGTDGATPPYIAANYIIRAA